MPEMYSSDIWVLYGLLKNIWRKLLEKYVQVTPILQPLIDTSIGYFS